MQEAVISLGRIEDAALIAGLIHDGFREYEGRLDPPSAALNESPESIAGEMTGCAISIVSWVDGGIARSLVAAVEQEARKRGFEGVRLAVRIALPANEADVTSIDMRKSITKT